MLDAVIRHVALLLAHVGISWGILICSICLQLCWVVGWVLRWLCHGDHGQSRGRGLGHRVLPCHLHALVGPRVGRCMMEGQPRLGIGSLLRVGLVNIAGLHGVLVALCGHRCCCRLMHGRWLGWRCAEALQNALKPAGGLSWGLSWGLSSCWSSCCRTRSAMLEGALVVVNTCC